MTDVEGDLWGVCGWFGDFPTDSPPGHVLSRMAEDFSGTPDSRLLYVDRHAAVALSSGTPGRELIVDGKLCVALFGHPSWSEPELVDYAKRTTNAAAALLAYRRWGRELLSRLHGAFGLIILDRERGEALIAIDRLGIRTLSFSIREGQGVVFATSSTAVARHPAMRVGISPQGVFNYLFFYRVPAPGTIFTGINKLLPAQLLWVSNARHEPMFYWQMPFGRSRATRHELEQSLFEALRAGVERAVAGERWDRLGTFLSGGLDSSTITGLVNELSPSPVKAFTIGFDSPGHDEREYAAAAARHFAVDHRVYEVTPADVLSAVSRIAAAYDEPFGNASAVPVYYCARFAKSQGVDTLIAGDGGDELFAGNAAHLQMKTFEQYGRLPAFFRQLLVEPIVERFPAGSWNVLGRKAKSYVDQANIPMPDRMFGSECALIAQVASIMEPDWLRDVDPESPIRILREAYARPSHAAFEQRVHQLELQVVLADNDLRKVNRMCALAGVNVRFPMLDEAVCSFSATIPSELLLQGMQLRAFFKRALARYLPKATLTKRKHGFGLPVGPWLSPGTSLQKFAYDCLASLGSRQMLRADFIDGVMNRHRQDPRPFNADSIWDLMMLELWLASHAGLVSR